MLLLCVWCVWGWGGTTGEEEVRGRAPGECVDSGGAQLCGLVATGVLTCETDFCPDCTNAHKCDSTCDFDCAPAAGGGGGGKHGGGGGKHRRAQGIQLNHVCSALNIDEKVRKRVSLRHFIY